VDRLKRLDRLLKLRGRKERQARLQMALCVKEDLARREARDEAERQAGEARELWRAEVAHGLGAGRLGLLRSYLDVRQSGLRKREALVGDWQPRLDAARKELSQASRERQALDSWRERLRQRLAREEERAERRRMDEIGLREALRRLDPEHGEA
jgi:flagellar export protein FliJ